MNVRTRIRTLCLAVLCFAYSSLTAQNQSHPIVDVHCHVKTIPAEEFSPFISMEQYFTENESFNIKYLFGLTIARRNNIEETKTRNDSLFSMARRNSRFIPVYSVHPLDGDAAIEELRRIKDLGGKIIKLHPSNQTFQILGKEMLDVASVAGELGLIILIDGYGMYIPNYLEHLIQLTLANRQTKFIIAHMGGADFHKLGAFSTVRILNPEMFANIWYDLSATVHIYANSPYKSQLEWTIRSIGVDRVLFGTDNPLVSLSESLKSFYQFDFEDTEREKILYKNAIELLGLQ
jgi:predicted TIM-barrel fold metal-dependent hydrolase